MARTPQVRLYGVGLRGAGTATTGSGTRTDEERCHGVDRGVVRRRDVRVDVQLVEAGLVRDRVDQVVRGGVDGVAVRCGVVDPQPLGDREPAGPRLAQKDLAEPAQRPVLRDPNGAGSRPDRLRGLLRRQPDRQPQHQDLALTGSQVREELAQPGGHLGGEQAVLGAVRGDRAVRQVRHRLGAVAPDRPEGVGHLVRGDAVDEGPERQTLELVVRQGADDRHADILRDVVGGAHERLLAPEAGAAVLQHERMDQREKVVAGPGVATDRACDQRVDHRAGVGLPLGWGDRLVRAGRNQAVDSGGRDGEPCSGQRRGGCDSCDGRARDGREWGGGANAGVVSSNGQAGGHRIVAGQVIVGFPSRTRWREATSVNTRRAPGRPGAGGPCCEEEWRASREVTFSPTMPRPELPTPPVSPGRALPVRDPCSV